MVQKVEVGPEDRGRGRVLSGDEDVGHVVEHRVEADLTEHARLRVGGLLDLEQLPVDEAADVVLVERSLVAVNLVADELVCFFPDSLRLVDPRQLFQNWPPGHGGIGQDEAQECLR